MATVTKTIGTSSRDYSTITLWEADLDNVAEYSAADDAVGECYNDSAFDETVTINGGGTIGLTSQMLTVASGERHDGTAGTGARIVRTGTGATIACSYDADTRNLVVEWLEIDKNGNTGRAVSSSHADTQTPESFIIRNIIAHSLFQASSSVQMIGGTGDYTLLNSILYDAEVGSGNTGSIALTSVASNRDAKIINNTGHLVHHNRSNESSIGFTTSNRGGSDLKNNVCTDVTAVTSSLAICFGSPATATKEYNASSDDSAETNEDSATSVINIVTADQYVSTAGGSEDLHLKSGADAIGAGTDLGTIPSGVEIDINGRDRDAEGDTWDIGAHQFVAAGGGTWSVTDVDLDESISDGQTGIVATITGTVAATGKKVFLEQGGTFVEQTVTGETASTVTFTCGYGSLTAGAANLYVRNPL